MLAPAVVDLKNGDMWKRQKQKEEESLAFVNRKCVETPSFNKMKDDRSYGIVNS